MSAAAKNSNVVAKGLQKFVNEYRVPLQYKNMKVQVKEINGNVQFNKGLYHCQSYENLLSKLVPLRVSYAKEKNNQTRESIANEQYSCWREYLEGRKKELPKEFEFTETMKLNLKNGWVAAKPRKSLDMPPFKFIELHKEFIDCQKFDIPIYPRILQRIVHPHFNYLSNLQRSVTLEEFYEMYQNFIVASFEESLGQELLAQEILALSFWNHVFKEKGAVNLREISDFFKIYRMNIAPDFEAFQKEFKFALSLHKKEFIKETDPDANIIRFDFFRYLALERNL